MSSALPSARREQQMHAIGHQAARMHCAFELAGQFAETREVTRIAVIVILRVSSVFHARK